MTPLIRGWAVLVVIIFGIGRDMINTGDGGGGIRELLALGIGWLLLAIFVIVLLAAFAGFLAWYFTRFVIDDDELRVETGWLAKRSRRIAFERIQSVDIIQPLAARIFGLVELRIEAGAGGDSRTTLRYLTRTKATRLRDYLMARAHGDRVSVASSESLPEASAFTDLSTADRKLVTIGPPLLIKGMLLSSEFLVLVIIALAALVIGIVLGQPFVSVAGLFPVLVFGVLNLGRRRVVSQFNYTLAESSRGLRITRGLTNLTSQSLPLDRIQGVRISRPLLWRRLGWSRVDVDVLGYGTSNDSSENSTDVSSILLPIATEEQVRLALGRVLPGADLGSIPLHPSPRRARAIRWFDGWTLRYGWNDAVIVSRHGFLDQTTDVVPHAKTQSVRITQGPLQRRLRLASVHVDTPKGPVNLVADHLDPTVARDLALTQLDRARRARAADRTVPDADADGPVLRRFGLAGVQPLGSGGESVVYPLGDDHVLRVYRDTHESAAELITQLEPAYRDFARYHLGFATPMIIEHGQTAGRTYSIDRRIPGVALSSWLPTAEREHRRAALLDYLRVAASLQQLPIPAPNFARLFGHDRRTFATLGDLLEDQLRGAVRRVREGLDRDLPADAVERVIMEVRQRQCRPALVHGDYFPGNVFVDPSRLRSGDPAGDGPAVEPGAEGFDTSGSGGSMIKRGSMINRDSMINPSSGASRDPAGDFASMINTDSAPHSGSGSGSGAGTQPGAGTHPGSMINSGPMINTEPLITGVGDFSPHTLAADPVLDLAGAVHLLGLEDYAEVAEDQQWLLGRALDLYEPYVDDLEHWLDVYRRYYAIYFADDPLVYPHSLTELER